MASFSLEDRRAVVTGAASGIGAAIALAYAEAGARLVLADLNETRLATQADACRALGVTVQTVIADVGEEAGAHGIVDRCIEAYGGIDILVNNAGMLTQARCTDLTTSMWDDMMRVDLRSVFLCSRRALPSMTAQRWGRIINVASQLGIKGGAELTHYAAAKAGVIGFTKSLALEAAPDNVLVNAIAPGPIETPLVDGISASWKEMKAKELPLRRFGRAEEVAPTAVLLASDPGGNLFVGQTLGPNSGDVMP
ncbi:SDR family NAD(P)-dependent oxidoreductase [Caballeronia sp. TF1N1]|uniref:SDR family NAD(P)-dependent oxidoreductase n=1 Tax=Caballeronia sp. TF1N1 TaxID=2878153 RepID=UPI001FD5E323|nr:SDR family oxidoreductase [Caballeronia sp. TF1N1]